MGAGRKRGTDPSGLLLLDKPLGMSSFQAARKAASLLGIRKVGHAGTLDPAASGLLPLFFGPATRLVDFLSLGFKEYEADLRLGLETDTLDAEGRVVAEADVDPGLDWPRVEAACRKFVGRIEQTVPAYSAVKVEGRRLYALARKGEAPESLPRRIVEIARVDLLELKIPDMRIRVRCGKGTYIRVLAADLGRALGTLASLTGLVRTAVGPLRLADAVGLAQLEGAEDRRRWLRSPLLALADLPRLDLPEDLFDMVGQGRILEPESGQGLWDNLEPNRPAFAPAPDGSRVAIVEVRQGRLRPRKVISLQGAPGPATS